MNVETIVLFTAEGSAAVGCLYYGSRILGRMIYHATQKDHHRTASNPHGYTRRRAKNKAMREVQLSWRKLYKGELAAKAVTHEHRTWKRKELVARRQAWATDFEELAGHTWDGSWTPLEQAPDHAKGYYAYPEHWKALTDPQRWELVHDQTPDSYVTSEYSDQRKREIARRRADAWIAEGSPDLRTPWLAERDAQLEQNRAQKQRAIEQAKVKKLAKGLSKGKPAGPGAAAFAERIAKLEEANRKLQDQQRERLQTSLDWKQKILADLVESAPPATESITEMYDMRGDDNRIIRMDVGAPPEDDEGDDFYSLSAL